MSCPDDCPHLQRHAPYQESRTRVTESFEESDAVLKDKRLMWLVFHVETALDELAAENPSFTDGEAVKAMEWALDEIRKERRLILLPGETGGPVDPAGQALLNALEACRFSKSVLLETRGDGYSREDKILSLKFLLQGARHLSQEETEGRAFLDFIANRLARLKAPRV